VRSHGWYDLPPFSYDRERGVLRTLAWSHDLAFRVRGGRLEASSESLDHRRLAPIARRVFSLDVDLRDAARYPQRTLAFNRGAENAAIASPSTASALTPRRDSSEFWAATTFWRSIPGCGRNTAGDTLAPGALQIV